MPEAHSTCDSPGPMDTGPVENGPIEAGPIDAEGPVSVVVCNYNGEGYLTACLDAIFALEGGVDECLVIDNQSTDRSLELIAERYPEPRVRVISMPSNDGPARARNAGMRAAKNRLVLAVDNDAMPRPDLLSKLRAGLAATPDAAIVQPRSVFRHEPARVHYDGGHLHCAGLIALRNFYVPGADAEGEGLVELDVAVSVCLLVDRDRILELGGYDESMFILFEDLDLSYRLRAAGQRILSVEDAVVEHDAGTPGVSFRQGTDYPSSRVFYHSRNRWLFLLRCFSLRALLLLTPALLLYEFVWLTFTILQGGTFAYFRGKREVLARLAAIRGERRTIQAFRTVPDRDLLVGGPLTLTPSLKQGRFAALLTRTLDLCLRGWWGLVRVLC